MSVFRRLFIHSPFRYVAGFIIAIGVSLLVLISNGFDLKIYYADALTTAGLVDIFWGLLVFVSTLGAFDTFGYAFGNIGHKRYKDLPEYIERRQNRRTRGYFNFMPYIVIGIIFLAVGLIIYATI